MTAPSQTQAEHRIKVGQLAIQKAASSEKQRVTLTTSQSKKAVAPLPILPIKGSDMTLIGDSVALASAPALETTFPGILVDAKVSRALRTGGFDEVDSLNSAGNLRRVVIIGLATNGYFGTGNLDVLMDKLGKDRIVIFVTGHAPDDTWVADNNDYLRRTAKQYPNMYIAEWDNAISAHPDEIGPDNIHPDALPGEQLYADCISTALAQAEHTH